MKKLLIIFVGAVMCLSLVGMAQAASVNVSLKPSIKIVPVSNTFELELWLESSDGSAIVMDDAHLLLEWDPAYIGFSGSASTADGDYDWTTAMSGPAPGMDFPMYPWEGSAGENATYTDGDAWIMLYPGFYWLHGMSEPQTDLHAVTLTFTALALTDSTVINIRPMTYAECGVNSGIIDPGGYPVGGIGIGANVEIVPEPATICLLGLGGLALLRRKR